LPAKVQLGGRVYRKSNWTWPRKGAVAQYREPLEMFSRHLIVFEDGHYEVDHLDDYNPDRGSVLGHLIADVIRKSR
jgi:hypothetical protein